MLCWSFYSSVDRCVGVELGLRTQRAGCARIGQKQQQRRRQLQAPNAPCSSSAMRASLRARLEKPRTDSLHLLSRGGFAVPFCFPRRHTQSGAFASDPSRCILRLGVHKMIRLLKKNITISAPRKRASNSYASLPRPYGSRCIKTRTGSKIRCFIYVRSVSFQTIFDTATPAP